MLVSGKELFQAAKQGGYAVGAFNVNNMEIIQAIIEAAEEEKSPVFLQASQGASSTQVLSTSRPWPRLLQKRPQCLWPSIWITEPASAR